MANLKDLIVNGSARVLGTLYAPDIRDTSRITEFIVGTQSSATGSWVGATKDNILYDGKNINYFLPVAGSGNASLNLTLSNGTTTGAKPVYLSGTSYVTTHYAANSCINMTYNATKDAWFVNADRDNNNDTYDRVKVSNNIHASAACTNGKLICGNSTGYKDVAASVTFDIDYPVLYCGTAISSGNNGTNNYLSFPGVNLQTTKASWTGTQWSCVYLVGTLSGKTFTVDSSVFTTTVPSTEDGKVYMPIGILYSTYQTYFHSPPVLYAYIDGSFQQYTSAGGGGVSRNIGEIVVSTMPLTDAGLHLLDGSLIDNGVYSEFITYMATLYSSGDYDDIFTTEATWQSTVTNTGVCGKFVYNSTNSTVRLPKYSNDIYTSIDSTIGVKGNGIALGFTDGTSDYGLAPTVNTENNRFVKDDAFGLAVGGSTTTGNYPGTGIRLGITTDSTKSGMVADLSSITTALEGYYYIVLSNSTKTEIEVDIDEVVTDLNRKIDKGEIWYNSTTSTLYIGVPQS